jgi:hypothetical protein
MTDSETDLPDDSASPSPDDLFVAAARAPEAEVVADPDQSGTHLDDAATPDDTADGRFETTGQAEVAVGPAVSEDEPSAADSGGAGDGEATPMTSADSPFPDGAGGYTPLPDATTPTDAPPTDQYLAPAHAGFGYHVPPPAGPDGQGGSRAGAYPAGPPMNPQPQFGRRAPQRAQRTDADGFYPGDYYLGVDWMRVVLGGLMATVFIVALVGTGLYLFDRFDPRDDNEEVEVAEATPPPVVDVYACAGDPEPVTSMEPPPSFLITGRDGGNRWLAFRNPQSGRRQLWIRSSSVPTFDPSTVGVVSCATGDVEFPTPLSGPTPSSGVGVATPSSGGPTPTPVQTPTPTG